MWLCSGFGAESFRQLAIWQNSINLLWAAVKWIFFSPAFLSLNKALILLNRWVANVNCIYGRWFWIRICCLPHKKVATLSSNTWRDRGNSSLLMCYVYDSDGLKLMYLLPFQMWLCLGLSAQPFRQLANRWNSINLLWAAVKWDFFLLSSYLDCTYLLSGYVVRYAYLIHP